MFLSAVLGTVGAGTLGFETRDGVVEGRRARGIESRCSTSAVIVELEVGGRKVTASIVLIADFWEFLLGLFVFSSCFVIVVALLLTSLVFEAFERPRRWLGAMMSGCEIPQC